MVIAEDMYGVSEVLADGLSVKEAKAFMKKALPFIEEQFDGGNSVKYLKREEVRVAIEKAA